MSGRNGAFPGPHCTVQQAAAKAARRVAMRAREGRAETRCSVGVSSGRTASGRCELNTQEKRGDGTKDISQAAQVAQAAQLGNVRGQKSRVRVRVGGDTVV